MQTTHATQSSGSRCRATFLKSRSSDCTVRTPVSDRTVAYVSTLFKSLYTTLRKVAPSVIQLPRFLPGRYTSIRTALDNDRYSMEELAKTGRAPATPSPLREGQLVAELSEVIRRRILKGELAAGMRVLESVIAAEHGVSRAPVREALRLLERGGLVSKLPNRSYVVTRLGEHDIHELATLRIALETLAVRLAFGRAELLPGLEAALPAIRKAVEAQDYEAAMQADREFHEVLIRAADHSRLADAYANLSDQVEMAHITYYRRRPDISKLYQRHEALVEIVRSGTEAQLIDAMTDHIQRGLGIVRNAL
jgi:DNA-binding GntR family transcriptional regulator